MTKPRATDDRWIQAIYVSPDPRALKPTAECPGTDRLQAAVAAELSAADRREILDHTLHCAYCTESWRIAAQLGLKPEVPLWNHFAAVLCADLHFLLELPSRFGRFFTDAGSGSRRLLAAVAAAAAAAVLVLAVREPLFGPAEGSRHDLPTTHRGGPELRVLTFEGETLPRDDLVLRWAGPAAARYDVSITSADGDLVDAATDLAAPRYQVPADRLGDLEPGSVLSCRVWLRLPDGDVAVTKSFSVRVE